MTDQILMQVKLTFTIIHPWPKNVYYSPVQDPVYGAMSYFWDQSLHTMNFKYSLHAVMVSLDISLEHDIQ